MMSQMVSWVLAVSVQEGKQADYEALVGEMVASAKAEEGTLAYEYFLTDDGSTCHILERFEDSAAALTHLGNFGSRFAERFMACVQPVGIWVYGDPSDDVRGVLDGFGAVYLGPFDGFRR